MPPAREILPEFVNKCQKTLKYGQKWPNYAEKRLKMAQIDQNMQIFRKPRMNANEHEWMAGCRPDAASRMGIYTKEYFAFCPQEHPLHYTRYFKESSWRETGTTPSQFSAPCLMAAYVLRHHFSQVGRL